LNNKSETKNKDDEMFTDNKFEITMSPKKLVELNESKNENINKLDTSIANTSIEINVKLNLLGDESKNAISVNNLNDSINERIDNDILNNSIEKVNNKDEIKEEIEYNNDTTLNDTTTKDKFNDSIVSNQTDITIVKFNNKIDKLNQESKDNNNNYYNETLNNTKFDQTVIFENESDEGDEDDCINNIGFSINNYFNYSFEWFKRYIFETPIIFFYNMNGIPLYKLIFDTINEYKNGNDIDSQLTLKLLKDNEN